MSRVGPIVMLGVGIGALSGCATSSPREPEHLRQPLSDAHQLAERGARASESGDFIRAEQYFTAAIAAGGDRSTLVPQLLRACVASGHLRLAGEISEAELPRTPHDGRLRFLAGAIQASLGNRALARDHLVRAATELPNSADVQFAVATFFRDDLGDRVDADPYFRAYLALAPKGPHAEEAKGSLMARIDRAEERAQ